jgi:hypothetical protein
MARLRDGDHIVGVDIGRRQNQLVLCKLRVDSTHADGFTMVSWGGVDFRGNDSLATVTRELCEMKEPRLRCDYMCIEQQSSRNVWCFGLAHVLQAYMHITYPACSVRHTAPRSKFATLDPQQLLKRGSTYRAQKRWAVDLCERLIANQHAASCKIFTQWEKKDDLADAFLYACAFLRQKKPQAKKTRDDAVSGHTPLRPADSGTG